MASKRVEIAKQLKLQGTVQINTSVDDAQKFVLFLIKEIYKKLIISSQKAILEKKIKTFLRNMIKFKNKFVIKSDFLNPQK